MDICSSEAEAKDKSLKFDKTNKYPVYVFNSDTTGEKLYEEFSTENEEVDWDSYKSLAIARAAKNLNVDDISIVINQLKGVFDKEGLLKTDIVNILTNHIPSFGHAEKGVTLDNRM
jgi:hypothetical protein